MTDATSSPASRATLTMTSRPRTPAAPNAWKASPTS